VTKTFVRKYHPGSFVSETSDTEVADRNWLPGPDSYTYSWYFYDKEFVEINGEVLTGKPKNISPIYYYGLELSAEEAMRVGNDILRSNIRGSGIKRLVKTKWGQMFPVNDGDIVLLPPLEKEIE